MNSPETQLLRMATHFVTLQRSLLTTWLNTNNGSCDLAMLLDFPKRSTVNVDSEAWQATRHGLGVRFVRPDGLTVDVPIAVNHPNAIDSGRLFDFLVSHSPESYELLTRNREPFSVMFDKLVQSGSFKNEPDSLGRPLFAIRSN